MARHPAENESARIHDRAGNVAQRSILIGREWVAYASSDSDKSEIYVTAFPEAHGKWQFPRPEGLHRDGAVTRKRLFYLAPDGKMMAVSVNRGANFVAGTPVALFQAHAHEFFATSEQVSYDVTKDGQRFLINTQVKNADTHPMSAIMNGDAELKKKQVGLLRSETTTLISSAQTTTA